MHAAIRRYEGITDVDEVVRLAEGQIVPILREVPGFVAYYVIDAGGGVGVSISVYDDQTGAEASTAKAAEIVGDQMAALLPNRPQITTGEVRLRATQ